MTHLKILRWLLLYTVCLRGRKRSFPFFIYIRTAALHNILGNKPGLKFLPVLRVPTENGKNKGQPITCHRWRIVRVGAYPYPFLASALEVSWWPTPCPGRIYPRDRAPVVSVVQEAGYTAGQV